MDSDLYIYQGPGNQQMLSYYTITDGVKSNVRSFKKLPNKGVSYSYYQIIINFLSTTDLTIIKIHLDNEEVFKYFKKELLSPSGNSNYIQHTYYPQLKTLHEKHPFTFVSYTHTHWY